MLVGLRMDLMIDFAIATQKNEGKMSRCDYTGLPYGIQAT
jgi:hypothetical protein